MFNVDNLRRICFATLAAVTVAGCNATTGSIIETKKLPGGQALVTSADVRSMNWIGVQPDESKGGIWPTTVVCAEPSPDVAKAVQSAFNASASLGAAGIQGVDGQAALALSRAQAASIAQLGERLATIQLLRDGLYRACEAYANGAISSITYAVLVSRYDDTVVTLMASELAAGAFGRSLAALTGETSGSAKASGDFATKIAQRQEAERSLNESITRKSDIDRSLSEKRVQRAELENQLDESRKQEGQVEDQIAAADPAEVAKLEQQKKTLEKRSSDLESDIQRTDKQIAELQSQRQESEKQVTDNTTDLARKLEAEAQSKASAGAQAAGGITPGQQNPEIAKTLATIQRKYVENINSDALEVACVTAMSEKRNSPLAAYCQSGILPQLIEARKELLKAILERAWHEKDFAAKQDRLQASFKEMKDLLDALKPLQPAK